MDERRFSGYYKYFQWKDPPTDVVFETKLRCVFDATPEAQSVQHVAKDVRNFVVLCST